MELFLQIPVCSMPERVHNYKSKEYSGFGTTIQNFPQTQPAKIAKYQIIPNLLQDKFFF